MVVLDQALRWIAKISAIIAESCKELSHRRSRVACHALLVVFRRRVSYENLIFTVVKRANRMISRDRAAGFHALDDRAGGCCSRVLPSTVSPGVTRQNTR